ncbi:MAG: hypothetical protein K6G52_03985 [Treponemataceae bacterium]|nr:hypothetical protein [Treponemataceae bacterium]
MDQTFKILFENPNFLIALKPRGLATAPISFEQFENNNLLSKVAKLYPDVLNVKNSLKECEYGLIHRIDTDTKGIVLIARNTEFWKFIQESQKKGLFVKNYTAYTKYDENNTQNLGGFPTLSDRETTEDAETAPGSILETGSIIQSYFRNYGKGKKEVRPVLLSKDGEKQNYAQKKLASDKLYTTKILSVTDVNELKKIKCEITAGFRHQVRCHLAWLNHPVVNDSIYNFSNLNTNEPMMFYATGFSFPDFNDKNSTEKLFFDFSDEVERPAD